MTRARFINHPTPLANLRFEDYYDESYGDGWQDNKAQRLEIKRWRKLKHQLT